jgi:hypothetical protein
MPFTNPTDPSFPPVSLNPPFFIWRDWCMGDSLAYINANTQFLDTTITTVSGLLQNQFNALSAVFPLNSIYLNTNSVTNEKILNSAITTDKIANGAVTTVKIFDFAVTEQKLGNNSVTNVKIQNNVIDQFKLQNNSVVTDKIADRAVTSIKLADEVITSAKIANNTIGTNKVILGRPGDWWNKISSIDNIGGLEIGRYIDFHNSNTDFSDYTYRIDNNINGNLSFLGSLAIASTLTVQNGEIVCSTPGNTGAIFFNNNKTFSLRFNGSRYSLPSTGLDVGGSVTSTYLYVSLGGGDEGGQIELQKPATNSVIAGNVMIDSHRNFVRFFEGATPFRGAYIDLTECTSLSKLWHDNNTTNAVTESKILNGAVTNSKILNSAVTTEKINNLAITSDKINSFAVTRDKIASNAITEDKIEANAITSVKIADNAVTSSELANGAVDTAAIIDNAVTEIKIANSSVTNAKIADGSVNTVKIANTAVTTDKILDNAITTNKINNSSVTTGKIVDGNITTSKIADGNITTSKIADGNITTSKIADNSITTSKIVDGNITTSKIANSSVTLSKIDISAPGARWNKVASIFGDGVFETGRYIDFHNTNANTGDNTYRIDNFTNNNLHFSGHIVVQDTITTGGRVKPSGWGGGLTTFDVYSDSGSIGIGQGGSLRCYITNDGQITINNGSPTIFLQDLDGQTTTLHCNNDRFYILRGAVNQKDWAGWPFPLEMTHANQFAYFGGQVFAFEDGAHRRLATRDFVNTLTDNGTNLVPSGAVMAFARSSIPAGWLLCNGAAVSRATYAALFAVIGTTYGAGNGSTTFNIPDLRGVFIRGLGGSSAELGVYQADAMQYFWGQFMLAGTEGAQVANGVFAHVATGGRAGGGHTGQAWNPLIDLNAARVVRTAGETRPVNRALNYCIKF